MENDSSMLIEELEKEHFLNEMIESNLEMDNLLLESDFALETAESELKATSKAEHSIISEDDETSSALSIEVSEDLFKGYTSDLKFSPLYYTSDTNENTKPDSLEIPEKLNHLLDDFNTTLKNYNTVFQHDQSLCNELDEINDKTITADLHNELENINKAVNIKTLHSVDSADDNDCLYIDLYNTTLEITVPNDVDDNNDHTPGDKSKLKHYNNFQGCSPDFDSNKITNDFTVIVTTENNSKPKVNSCESVINADNEINSLVVDLNDIDEKITDSETIQINNDIHPEFNDNTSKKSETTTEITSSMIPTELNYIIDEQIVESIETNYDIQPEFKANIITEITSCIDLTTEVSVKEALNDTQSLNVSVENKNVQKNSSQILETLIEQNITPQCLKRPADDIIMLEVEVKKPKLEEKLKTVAKETEPGDATLPGTDTNFTQVIFDPDETADHNDPKWSVLKDLETHEDYFKSVRNQWRLLSLPNPHKNITTRYVPKHIANIKPHTITSSENERIISCGEFLDKRIKNISCEIKDVNSKMNSCFPRFRSRSSSSKNANDLEQLEKLQREVEKNKEELKHINMFYYNDSQGWNANFLTRSELSELREQDSVLEFQKSFYKS